MRNPDIKNNPTHGVTRSIELVFHVCRQVAHRSELKSPFCEYANLSCKFIYRKQLKQLYVSKNICTPQRRGFSFHRRCKNLLRRHIYSSIQVMSINEFVHTEQCPHYFNIDRGRLIWFPRNVPVNCSLFSISCSWRFIPRPWHFKLSTV
jgi:hypothetical protein